MNLTISEHTEFRLTEEARRQGISVDALLEELINERVGKAIAPQSKAPELPVWHLGATDSFHRRDIYSDVH